MSFGVNDVRGFSLKGGRKIPENRIIKILGKDDSDILGVPLFYDGALSLKVSSKYASLWDGGSSNLLTLLSATSDKIPSGQFAMQGTQIWQSTDPLSLDFTARLEMKDSALRDVVAPVYKLMSMCLPTKQAFMGGEGITIGKINLKLDTLIPPGPDIRAILKGTINLNGEDALSDWFNRGGRGYYNIKIGNNVTIPKVIITDVQPTFSKWTDEEDNPVSAEVSISMTTMEVATTDMMANIFKGISQSELGSITGAGGA